MKRFLLAIFAFFLLQTSAIAQNENGLWITILRADGLLTPIARFDGGNWINTWPETDNLTFDTNDNPSNPPTKWQWSTTQIPKEWVVFTIDGKKSFITGNEPVLYSSHCGINWGLKTDYPSDKEGRHNPAKVGIAVNQDMDFLPATLDKSPALKLPLLSYLNDKFSMNEAIGIQRAEKKQKTSGDRLSYTGHPIDKSVRELQPFSVNRLEHIKGIDDKINLYAFSIDRKYQKPANFSDQSCSAISHYSGLVFQDTSGSYHSFYDELAITDCDGKGSSFLELLGAFKVGGEWFQIRRTTYYESEYIYIDKIEEDGPKRVAGIFVGGC